MQCPSDLYGNINRLQLMDFFLELERVVWEKLNLKSFEKQNDNGNENDIALYSTYTPFVLPLFGEPNTEKQNVELERIKKLEQNKLIDTDTALF